MERHKDKTQQNSFFGRTATTQWGRVGKRKLLMSWYTHTRDIDNEDIIFQHLFRYFFWFTSPEIGLVTETLRKWYSMMLLTNLFSISKLSKLKLNRKYPFSTNKLVFPVVSEI